MSVFNILREHNALASTQEDSTGTRVQNYVNTLLPQPISMFSVAYQQSGASARIGGSILTAPLDTIKARRQFSRKSANVRNYATAGELVKSMVKNEGMSSFYRGLPARLVYVGPASAISFFFYEQFKDMVHRPKVESTSYQSMAVPLVAAGVLRVAGTTLRTPFDVVRQRMQVMGGLSNYQAGATEGRGVYKNTFQALKGIIAKEGVLSLFSGVLPTILRDVPFSITYFLAYEGLRSLQMKWMGGTNDHDNLKVHNHMLAGGLAAGIAVVVSNPLDLIKTRMQTQGSLEVKPYNNAMHCFRTVLANEGAMAFYKGLGPRILYLCPSAAITFALYEQFKQLYADLLGIDQQQIRKPPKDIDSDGSMQ